jgi:hypothetical protein
MKLVGERRALAAIVFAFFFIQYLMAAIMKAVPPGYDKAFYALAGCYGLAFVALVAGYFWARWYSVGVGLFGVIIGAVGLWKEGPEFQILLVGGLHLAATVSLWGEAMSTSYDGKTAWREKLHMDDSAVQRLGRSVIRAGVSLPIVLIYALAPRPGGMVEIASITAFVVGGLGLRALIRMRTWGVLALGAAGALMVVVGLEQVDLYPTLAGSLMMFAAVPFAAPMLRLIRA